VLAETAAALHVFDEQLEPRLPRGADDPLRREGVELSQSRVELPPVRGRLEEHLHLVAVEARHAHPVVGAERGGEPGAQRGDEVDPHAVDRVQLVEEDRDLDRFALGVGGPRRANPPWSPVGGAGNRTGTQAKCVISTSRPRRRDGTPARQAGDRPAGGIGYVNLDVHELDRHRRRFRSGSPGATVVAAESSRWPAPRGSAHSRRTGRERCVASGDPWQPPSPVGCG
jgi:hypothetical protein